MMANLVSDSGESIRASGDPAAADADIDAACSSGIAKDRSADGTTLRQVLPATILEATGNSAAESGFLLLGIEGEAIDTQIEVRSRRLRIGRAEDCDLRLTDRRASRQHCEVWSSFGRVWARDLGATNQTCVNHKPIGTTELKPGDTLSVAGTSLCLVEKDSARARHHIDLSLLASTDELTRLLNRRKFMQRLQVEIERARCRGAKGRLALALIDIDHFKRINDGHGHGAGDEVLRIVGAVLRREVRFGDLVGRIGGEEFALAMLDVGLNAILEIAERIRQAIALTRPSVDGATLSITVSIGVARLSRETASAAELLAGADAQLYRAKTSGRNRSCLAS